MVPLLPSFYLYTKLNKMELKKKSFLDSYRKAFGNISIACKSVEISRGTYYNWKESDAEFAKALEQVEPDEEFIDFTENALYKKIKDGDTTAIIFALKTKGKKRGYVERQELVHEIERPIFKEIDLDVSEDNGTDQNI
jgi:hypothetical protein